MATSAAGGLTTGADAAPITGGGASGSHHLDDLKFDNRSIRDLPVDPIKENYSRQVSGATFSRVAPAPVTKPVMVAYSAPALALLELGPSEAEREDAAEYFAGNKVFPGAEPSAHCYAGHQFGAFSGQLGDGATMYLGEIVTDRGARVELQFKGAGKTPYSRTADGRKVLRSSVREFLCSELMWSLGIPTTRAGTVVTSDTKVVRDIFYSGNPINERATIITRLAPTFLRFGSFEIFKLKDPMTQRAGPSFGQYDLLKRLMDFTCKNYYPEIYAAHAGDDQAPQRFFAMYQEIVRRSARLVAMWQAYGWCHGVLNTDNMSIVGATIDYGPYGWMDRLDQEFICNTSDDGGRYSYENQPMAVRWNCAKLGEAFSPCMPGMDWKPVLSSVFDREFEWANDELWRRKLGLGFAKQCPDAKAACAAASGGAGGSAGSGAGDSSASTSSTVGDDSPAAPVYASSAAQAAFHPFECAAAIIASAPPVSAAAEGGAGATSSTSSAGASSSGAASEEDTALIRDLLSLMQSTGADFTNTFRALMDVDVLGADLKGDAAATTASTATAGGASSSTTTAAVGGGASSASSGSASSGDPVLAYILTQLATAKEIAEASAPRMPKQQLLMYLQLAQMDPRFADQLEGIQAEMAKHAQYEKLSKRKDEEKRAEDAKLWSEWLGKYRARIAAELPADVRSNPSAHHAAIRAYAACRQRLMAGANPKYVLRNWIAHAAIKKAEEGDFSEVRRVLQRMLDPYGLTDESKGGESAHDVAMAASHVAAPNMAAEGATKVSTEGVTMATRTGGGAGASESAGGSCGGAGATVAAGRIEDFGARPPPWACDLKVT